MKKILKFGWYAAAFPFVLTGICVEVIYKKIKGIHG